MQSSTIQNVTAKKVFIHTWGCQINEYDTQLIKAILLKEKLSFVETKPPRDQNAEHSRLRPIS